MTTIQTNYMVPFLNDKPRVNIQDNESILKWSEKLEISREELFYCVSKVGSSIAAIKKYKESCDQLQVAWMK